MGLWHRLEHIVQLNTVNRFVEIEDEVWVVSECRRCGAELSRWFYRRTITKWRK